MLETCTELICLFTHVGLLLLSSNVCQISSMSSSISRSSSGGHSPTSTFSGLTKTPNLSLHSKTLLFSRLPPPTSTSALPSFLPTGSSSSTPTHLQPLSLSPPNPRSEEHTS